MKRGCGNPNRVEQCPAGVGHDAGEVHEAVCERGPQIVYYRNALSTQPLRIESALVDERIEAAASR